MNRLIVFGAVSCLAAFASLSAACSSSTTTVSGDDSGTGGDSGGSDGSSGHDSGGGGQDSGGGGQDSGGGGQDGGTEGGGGDQACAAASTKTACRSCCNTNHAGGSADLQAAQIACVCKAGECNTAQACQGTLCANPPQNPNQACLDCANNKALSPDSGTSCFNDVVTACQNSAACTGYITCLGNSNCSGKP